LIRESTKMLVERVWFWEGKYRYRWTLDTLKKSGRRVVKGRLNTHSMDYLLKSLIGRSIYLLY
jgi:hypothetical protein